MSEPWSEEELAQRAVYEEAEGAHRLSFEEAMNDPAIGTAIRAGARARLKAQENKGAGPHWTDSCRDCGGKRLYPVHRADDENVIRCRDCGAEYSTED